jgi:type IV secretion system protein VirB11
MISAQQIQERRRDELLRRQLGPQLLAAIGDPKITDIVINEDGRAWFEAHRKGLFEAGFSISASQVESLI